MKRYIYLFRHGETYFNLGGNGNKKRFTGWKDAKLSPKGIKSARKLAKKMKNLKFDVAFQTRLKRSKNTLKEALKYHPECSKVIIDNRMIERSYGSMEGLMHKTAIKKYGFEKFEKWHRSYNTAPPKGESIKQVEKRVKSFINFI